MATKQETEEEKAAREVIESIANNLIQLSRSVSAFVDGKLKRKSLVLLLAHSSGLPQYQVDRVLEAIKNLEKDHVNK